MMSGPQESKVPEVQQVQKLSNNVKQGVIPISTQTRFNINPDISNDKHILNNMEAYMVNNTLPKDYCIKQYARILKFYNTNEVLKEINFATALLDFEKQNS